MAEYNTEIDLCPLQRKYDKIMEKEHHQQIPATSHHQGSLSNLEFPLIYIINYQRGDWGLVKIYSYRILLWI